MGPTILSPVERSSLSRRSNNTLKYRHGVETSVLCREVAPISEGLLSEVLLYIEIDTTIVQTFKREKYATHQGVAYTQ